MYTRSLFISKSLGFIYALIILIIFSCNNDDDEDLADTTNPQINVTNPTQAQFNAGFESGTILSVVGTVTDNVMLDRVNISLVYEDGTEVAGGKEITGINKASLSLNQPLVVPIVPEGNYTLRINAWDKEGNKGTFVSNAFSIRNDDEARRVVVFNVNTPETTPSDATVYIAGTFNGWNPADEDYLLTPVEGEENLYTITITWEEGSIWDMGVEYLFTLGASSVEKNASCDEWNTNTHIFSPGNEAQVIEAFIQNWAGYGDCPEDQIIQTTFIVTTPESTPEDASVYMTGSFNDWDPEDENYLLTPVEGEPNSYTITLGWQPGTEYKFTLGSMENVETGAECEEIDNRTFVQMLQDQVVEVTVENWMGMGPCE